MAEGKTNKSGFTNDVAKDAMGDEAYQARIAELEGQLEAEKAKAQRAVYLKVSEKGGASLYGIRRFPITFYVEEWNRILDMEPEIREFLIAHKDELTVKE
ncbi:MAG: hypothetical protein ACYSW8_26565 [Planctomycetota bacterium]|jgi:hypothetical protein